MKKSIALLTVLLFIVLLMSLSAVIFKIYDKYSSSSYKYITQDTLIIKDVSQILDQSLANTDIYDLLTTYPPISSKDGNFIVNVTISPIFNKININNYIENNKTNQTIDDTLNNILDFYEILDPIFFKDLLLDTIDTDTDERSADSEIILNEPFQNGLIYNKKHFQKILDYYALQKNDPNIYKIPWDKYIFFGDKNKYILDCNLIDKNLAKFIGLEFKNDIISCNNLEKNKKLIENLNIKPYDKNTTYWVKIDISYNQTNELNITYDTKSKKVVNIEKHFIY